MKDLKYIKSFVFDFAQYYLDDASGDKIMLKINYKENNYSVYKQGNIYNANFRKEVDDLAKSLLGKKSGINRVNMIKL